MDHHEPTVQRLNVATPAARRRDPADMPRLKQNLTTGAVYAVGHAFPTRDLFLRPDSWRVRVPTAHRRNRSSFGDYETSAGALLVVLPHQIVGNSSFTGSTSGERSHDNAIGKFPVADANWIMQCRHRFSKKGYPYFCPL